MRLRSIPFPLAWVVLALLLMGCQSTLAGAPEKSAGASPPAVPALSLTVDSADGSLLRASDGLFRSGDQGRSWEPLPLPAGMRKIRLIATSPAIPSSLYVAGSGAGIARSDDGGRSWRSISAGLPSQEVVAFAVHSFRPDTFYAWIAGQGVFRTEDGGGRWQRMDNGPPAPVAGLTHSTLTGSMNTGWLYAATPEGVYLSMDCF